VIRLLTMTRTDLEVAVHVSSVVLERSTR
jgi:hypothetical protein